MKNLFKKIIPTSAQKGVTLVSLLVGIAISALLVLVIAQLTTVGSQNFVYSRNLIEMHENALEAIEFLRQNVPLGGFGVQQPNFLANTQLNSEGIKQKGTIPPTGGAAALRDWSYIGYFQEKASPNQQFPVKVINAFATPASCASFMDTNAATIPFFGLQSCGQCWRPNAAFDKRNLATNPDDDTATCCQNAGACYNYPNCPTPIYNCGGLLQNAVYQKKIEHICVGPNCTGARANPSGDILTVFFSNPGASNITTFTGTTIVPQATEPPASYFYYSFQVDSATSTLKAVDSTQAANTYNIASNIEYMAILVGESDLYNPANLGTPPTLFSLPTMSRFVRFNTANIYKYRINAVRIAIVARSKDPILQTVPASTTMNLMLGNDGNMITYQAPADKFLRKVFITTIYLNSYEMPTYEPHCVQVGSQFYMKTGGIPFTNTWTTNDQCCGGTGACSKIYGSMDACETDRMKGGCF